MPKKTPEGTPPHVISARFLNELNEKIEKARQEWDMIPASDPVYTDEGPFVGFYVRMKYKDE